MIKPLLLALPGYEPLAASIAQKTAFPLGQLEMRRFPDGETYLRILTDVSEMSIILVGSLYHPDEKIIPIYLLTATLRANGAASVTLVVPYLAYMRQDKIFMKGEGLTAAYIATLLSSFLDGLITIDPHLHRIGHLEEVYTIPAIALQAYPLIAQWIKTNIPHPILIGPDSESEQWVCQVATAAQCPYIILQKKRKGDREVEISVPDTDKYKNHTPVLVDDIISTAHTMIETVYQLRKAGMEDPVCIGVHAIFAGTAYTDLIAAGVSKIHTCTTIPHPTNTIDISPLLSTCLYQYFFSAPLP